MFNKDQNRVSKIIISGRRPVWNKTWIMLPKFLFVELDVSDTRSRIQSMKFLSMELDLNDEISKILPLEFQKCDGKNPKSS